MNDPNPHDRHLWQFQWVRDLFIISCAIFCLWLGYRLSVITIPLLVALTAAYICEPVVAWLLRRCSWMGRIGASVTLLCTMIVLGLGLLAVILVPLINQTSGFIRDAPQFLQRAEKYLTDPKRPEWLRERLAPILAELPLPEFARDKHTAKTSADAAPDDTKGNDSTEDGLGPSAENPASGTEKNTASPDTQNSVDTDPAAAPADSAGDPAAAAVPTGTGSMDAAQRGFSMVASFIGGTTSTIFDIFIFLIIFFFSFVPLSARFPAVKKSFHNLFPEPIRDDADPLLNKMDVMISSFVRGRVITAALLAVLYATGWTICGVPYALVIGLVTGVASLVPYAAAMGLPIAWLTLAGACIGANEPGFYVSGSGDDLSPIWWKIILFPAIVNIIAQSLEDYVLTPLIQGNATHLHPVVIMLAIIAGGSLMGLYGMILAIPVAACGKVLFNRVIAPRLQEWAHNAATD